ncbi:uro-adherence factor A-like [Heterodontus francisci]|uniref:uro-adherence factor A-like n=1 Tax=Heterodontus francisci TaxID=7792 RepID=UPI00355BEA45
MVLNPTTADVNKDDLIANTETWQQDDKDCVLNIEGYMTFKKNREPEDTKNIPVLAVIQEVEGREELGEITITREAVLTKLMELEADKSPGPSVLNEVVNEEIKGYGEQAGKWSSGQRSAKVDSLLTIKKAHLLTKQQTELMTETTGKSLNRSRIISPTKCSYRMQIKCVKPIPAKPTAVWSSGSDLHLSALVQLSAAPAHLKAIIGTGSREYKHIGPNVSSYVSPAIPEINEIPSVTQDTGVISTDVPPSVGVTTEKLTNPVSKRSVNPGESTGTLEVKGFTHRCNDPVADVEDSKVGEGTVKITGSEDTANSFRNDEAGQIESSEGLPRNAKEANFENEEVLLDWAAPAEQETEEGGGRFLEEKDRKIKGVNTSDGDGRQGRGVGDTEDSRSADQRLVTPISEGESPTDPNPAKSEEHTHVVDNVEAQGAPENAKQSVSAVSTILSEARLLSLGVSEAGPDVEEREYVGNEEAGRVKSPSPVLRSILNVGGSGEEEASFKQEGFVIKHEQEKNLSQTISSSDDLETGNEDNKETLASIVIAGFKLEKMDDGTASKLLSPVLATGEWERATIDQTGISRMELEGMEWKPRVTPELENETCKGAESEEQTSGMRLEVLELSAVDIGEVYEAHDGKLTEGSVSKRQECEWELVQSNEDPEGASKIRILRDLPRADIDPVENGPVGKGLEIIDEDELRKGFFPIGSYQEGSRSNPEVKVSDLEQIPSEGQDRVSIVYSLEERMEDKVIGVDFEVNKEAVSKENSKTASMEMGSHEEDIHAMEPPSLIVEPRAELKVPALNVASEAQPGQIMINSDAAPETGPEIQSGETERDSDTKEDMSAPASKFENREVRLMEAGSGGNDGELDLRCLTLEAGRSEETDDKMDGDLQVQVQETVAGFVTHSEVCSLIDGKRSQTESGHQEIKGVEMKEDLEALTDDAETHSFAGIRQEDERGVKLQDDEADLGTKTETHPLKRTIGSQLLLEGEHSGTENQVTEVRAKQESEMGKSEKHLGHLTPEATPLAKAAEGGPEAVRGFSGSEPRDCWEDPEAERHKVAEPKAAVAMGHTAAEAIETNVGIAELAAENKVERVGERLVMQRVTVVVHTQDRESLETQDREMMVQTHDEETVLETQDREVIIETQDRETVAETQAREVIVETQAREVIVETQAREVIVETQARETVAETQAREVIVETQDREVIVETQDREAIVETQDRETVSETQEAEKVLEIQDRETVSQTKDQETVSETQDRETVLEMQNRETVSEICNPEKLSKTQDRETVSETQDREMIIETQGRETVSETQDEQPVSETRNREPVSETRDPETVSETQARGTMVKIQDPETQDRGMFTETQHKDTGLETQNMEPVPETQDKKGVEEAQDRDLGLETQNVDTVAEIQIKDPGLEMQDRAPGSGTQDRGPKLKTQARVAGSETQDRETVSETQDRDPGSETQDQEAVSETQDKETMSETWDQEIVSGTGVRETVSDTQDQEAVSETQDKETMSETWDQEIVSGTGVRETVSDTQDQETVSKTQDQETVSNMGVRKIVSEIRDQETVAEAQDEQIVSETQDPETVSETLDMEVLTEIQDKDHGLEIQNMEPVPETKDREGVEEFQINDPRLETQDMDPESESEGREAEAETSVREILVAAQDREAMVETQDREAMVETQDREAMVETQDREAVVETLGSEAVVETQDREVVVETQDREAMVETQDREAMVETQDREAVVETLGSEAVVETQDREVVVETQDREVVVETQDREVVVETQDREVVVETQDREVVVETQDREVVVETQDREAVVETLDREAVVETLGSEAVVETLGSEAVVETQDREAVVETQDREAVVETQDREAVVETQDREAVVETQDREAVVETQDREAVVETLGSEAVVETLGSEAVVETQDREAVVETQDRAPGLETQGRAPGLETQGRETIVGTQNYRTVQDTKSQEAMEELQDPETEHGRNEATIRGKAPRGCSASEMESSFNIPTQRSVGHWSILDTDPICSEALMRLNALEEVMRNPECATGEANIVGAAGDKPARSPSYGDGDTGTTFSNQSHSMVSTKIQPETNKTSEAAHVICLNPAAQRRGDVYGTLPQPETDGEPLPAILEARPNHNLT